VQLGGSLVVFDPIFTANGTVGRVAWLVHDFLFALDANTRRLQHFVQFLNAMVLKTPDPRIGRAWGRVW
jgi:hypothetical protein